MRIFWNDRLASRIKFTEAAGRMRIRTSTTRDTHEESRRGNRGKCESRRRPKDFAPTLGGTCATRVRYTQHRRHAGYDGGGCLCKSHSGADWRGWQRTAKRVLLQAFYSADASGH